MNCVIIGAGQLGSRHLEGLLKFSKDNLTIYVIDINSSSLQDCEKKTKDIIHNHTLIFSTDWEILPKQLFFSIVATDSKVREKITLTLLANYQIDLMLLEKVLFTNIEAYQNVEKALSKTDTRCFVNHPRRMYQSYQDLKKVLINEKQLHYQIVGTNWGLACNGLHFIDLIEYLSDTILLNLSTNAIDNEIVQSKRNGYIEMTGAINGNLANGSTFEIRSIADNQTTHPAIAIMGKDTRVYIQEVFDPIIYVYEKESTFKQQQFPLVVKYQSALTHIVLEDFIAFDTVNLPNYADASRTHQLFLSALLEKFNQSTNSPENTHLYIT